LIKKPLLFLSPIVFYLGFSIAFAQADPETINHGFTELQMNSTLSNGVVDRQDILEIGLDYEISDAQTASSNKCSIVTPYKIEYQMINPVKRQYVASLTLGRNIWPSGDQRVILGLKRPKYHLGKNTRILGNFDLKLERVMWKFNNILLVTFHYTVSKLPSSFSAKTEISIANIAFLVNFNFGN